MKTFKTFKDFINENVDEELASSFKQVEEPLKEFLIVKYGLPIIDLDIIEEKEENTIDIWFSDENNSYSGNNDYFYTNHIDKILESSKNYNIHVQIIKKMLSDFNNSEVMIDGDIKKGSISIGITIPFNEFVNIPIPLIKSLINVNKYNL